MPVKKEYDPLLNPELGGSTDSRPVPSNTAYDSTRIELSTIKIKTPGLYKPKTPKCLHCTRIFIKMICLLAFLALMAYMNYVALTYPDDSHECPQPLSTWLMITSAGGCAMLVIQLLTHVVYDNCGDRCEARCEAGCHWVNCSAVLTFTTLLAALVVGSIYTFSMDEAESDLCPVHLFHFSWYLLTATWGVIGGLLLLFCCAGACLCAKAIM